MPTIQSPQGLFPLHCNKGCRWSVPEACDRQAEHRIVDGKELRGVRGVRSDRKGIEISKARMKCLDIVDDQFHPEGNYTISPRPP